MRTFNVSVNVNVPAESADAAFLRIHEELKNIFGEKCLDGQAGTEMKVSGGDQLNQSGASLLAFQTHLKASAGDWIDVDLSITSASQFAELLRSGHLIRAGGFRITADGATDEAHALVCSTNPYGVDLFTSGLTEKACADIKQMVLAYVDRGESNQMYECEDDSVDTGVIQVLDRNVMMELSTAHIPRATSIALGESNGLRHHHELSNVLIYTFWPSSGWIIFCCNDHADSIREKHPELANIIDICVSREIPYLKLDGDADSLQNLPTFDW